MSLILTRVKYIYIIYKIEYPERAHIDLHSLATNVNRLTKHVK